MPYVNIDEAVWAKVEELIAQTKKITAAEVKQHDVLEHIIETGLDIGSLEQLCIQAENKTFGVLRYTSAQVFRINNPDCMRCAAPLCYPDIETNLLVIYGSAESGKTEFMERFIRYSRECIKEELRPSLQAICLENDKENISEAFRLVKSGVKVVSLLNTDNEEEATRLILEGTAREYPRLSVYINEPFQRPSAQRERMPRIYISRRLWNQIEEVSSGIQQITHRTLCKSDIIKILVENGIEVISPRQLISCSKNERCSVILVSKTTTHTIPNLRIGLYKEILKAEDTLMLVFFSMGQKEILSFIFELIDNLDDVQQIKIVDSTSNHRHLHHAVNLINMGNKVITSVRSDDAEYVVKKITNAMRR